MDTKIKPGTPFRSALLMTAAISALAASMRGMSLQLAINALGPVAAKAVASTAARSSRTARGASTSLTASVSALVASVRLRKVC